MKLFIIMDFSINLTEILCYMNTKIHNTLMRKLDELEILLYNLQIKSTHFSHDENCSLNDSKEALFDLSGINIKELLNKYRYAYIYTLNVNHSNKVSDDMRCQANTINNTQCTRKKLINESFCKNHMAYRPFGIINELNTNTNANANQSIDSINHDLYFETIHFKHEDKDYLIDMNGIIYTYNDACQIFGRQTSDGIIWWG